MEKGTKLKLKRKLKDPQQNISEEIKRDGTGSNARSNAHVSPVNYSDSDSVDIEEFVVLTSESDGEEPQEKQKKTLQGIESEPEQSDRSKRHFLDVKDTELRKLRELIMKISRNTSTQKVTDFPSHLSQYIDNSDKLAEATEEEPAALDAFVQARISYEIQEPNDGTKLSPFPSMCDWCRRRKSSKEKCCKKSRDIDKANLNNDHRNSVLNGDASQMVISVKEYNACSKSLANNSHLKEDTSQVLDKQINTASYGNKIITSKHLERDVVSNQRSSLPENNSETNNSHLMRDRNSNYYSLQSRNGDSIRARCSDRQTHILAVNQRNNTKNTAPTSLNKGFDNEKQADIVDVESNISDLGGVEMEDHDVSTFHLAFDSDSEMETETEGKSSIVAVHNEDPKVHEDLEGNLSEMDTKSNHITVQYQNIKVQKDAIQGKHSELVSKSTHQGSKRLQSKSSTGCIKQSGTRNNVENVNHGQVQDNIPTQGSH